MPNIFDFWADVPGDARQHPADAPILDRSPHGFDLDCLPSNISGPLRTARVVLLYLSPGRHDHDVAEAREPVAHQRYKARRTGLAPLEGPEEHPTGHKWWSSRTRRFGAWPELQHKLAILNIGAYHSASFTKWPMLAALPSSRATLDWAQGVLFPQAIAGERVVICMRSAAFWGLGRRTREGESLFVPKVNRGGHMLEEGDELATRADVAEAVKAALARPPLPA